MKKFVYDKKTYKDRVRLQIDLKFFLEQRLLNVDWDIEFKPSSICRDSVDIFGDLKSENIKIVIEIDPHRSDQVAKKFVSRSSLFMNDNVIYISVCYPGTEKMNKTECEKYFNYCSNICEFMTANSKCSKLFIGYFL